MKKKDIVGPIIIIVVALILIILPPVFRKYLASVGKAPNYDKSSLVCIKKASDNFIIKSNNKYNEDEDVVESILFEFTDNNVNNDSSNNNQSEQVTESKSLLKYFASLVGSNYSVVDNVSKIELSDDTKEYYQSVSMIKNIFSNYDTARSYYESEEYSCK